MFNSIRTNMRETWIYTVHLREEAWSTAVSQSAARESQRLAHPPQNLKQMKLQEAKQLSQCVDNAVFSFLVQGCQPFVLVEQPAFQSLVQDLQPNGTIISQTTVQLKINRTKTTVKENVKEAVMKTGYIATTFDCWSTNEEKF